MASNQWVPLQELADAVKALLPTRWSWAYNQRCKYVGIWIDMRDGHAYLQDRHGKRITLEQLRNQRPRPAAARDEEVGGG